MNTQKLVCILIERTKKHHLKWIDIRNPNCGVIINSRKIRVYLFETKKLMWEDPDTGNSYISIYTMRVEGARKTACNLKSHNLRRLYELVDEQITARNRRESDRKRRRQEANEKSQESRKARSAEHALRKIFR